MQDRTCVGCGSGFTPRRNGGKPQRYCSRDCRLAWANAHRWDDRSRRLAPCGICATPCRRYGTTAYCSDDCRRERERRRSAERYRLNPGAAYRSNRHLWRVSNARRQARLDVQTVPGTTEIKIEWRMDYFGRRCWVCGDEGTERDHVKPLAKGGLHTPANIRPICSTCNRSKKDTWPIAV